MGTIEEIRQVFQDFLAPELRAIGARLTAVEDRLNRMDAHFNEKFDKIDEKFERMDEKIDEKFARLEDKMRELFVDLRAEFLFDKRLSNVEAQVAEQKRPA